MMCGNYLKSALFLLRALGNIWRHLSVATVIVLSSTGISIYLNQDLDPTQTLTHPALKIIAWQCWRPRYYWIYSNLAFNWYSCSKETLINVSNPPVWQNPLSKTCIYAYISWQGGTLQPLIDRCFVKKYSWIPQMLGSLHWMTAVYYLHTRLKILCNCSITRHVFIDLQTYDLPQMLQLLAIEHLYCQFLW